MQLMVQDTYDISQHTTDGGLRMWLEMNGTPEDLIIFDSELHLKY